MSDGPPTEERTLSAYLDYLALACVFGVVEMLAVSKWLVSIGMFVASVVFHIVGIKWPRIKLKAATLLDWGLWGKRIAIGFRALLALAWVSVAIVGYYAWHSFSRTVPREQVSHQQPSWSQESPQIQEPTPPKTTHQSHKGTARPTAPKPATPSGQVDWHDKQNWRNFVRTGMTRTAVRKLFGEPDEMHVSGNLEFWEYGRERARITFDMETRPDGSLFSWDEPEGRH